MTIRDDFWTAFRWQDQYKDHLRMIAGLLRVEPAGWEDDARRNTDLLVLKMTNDWRIACRVRTPGYRDRYGDQFTVRLARPSGAPTEMAKMRDGFGDFGIYGFASPDVPGRLEQWCLYNIALLREYLGDGGCWYERGNIDGSSTLAVFDIEEVASKKLGFIHSSEGLTIDHWPLPEGSCRVCGHDTWQSDELGPVHDCCRLVVDAVPCQACAASAGLQHARWGWPDT